MALGRGLGVQECRLPAGRNVGLIFLYRGPFRRRYLYIYINVCSVYIYIYIDIELSIFTYMYHPFYVFMYVMQGP